VTLLSRKADYALLILSYLHDRPGTARAVAEKFGLSRPFVANILKELCHHGFVASHRGVKGGYDLARPANTITLAELMETLEDGVRLAVCNPGTHDHDVCSIAGVCTLKGPITQVHNRLIEVLRGITLAELFEGRVEPTQPAALLGLTLMDSSVSNTVKPSPA
jgi:Rrf2 family protein